MGKVHWRKTRGIGGIEVYLRHTIRIEFVSWDSLAWERDDMGGIIEQKPGSKQTKQYFMQEVVGLWNSV